MFFFIVDRISEIIFQLIEWLFFNIDCLDYPLPIDIFETLVYCGRNIKFECIYGRPSSKLYDVSINHVTCYFYYEIAHLTF